MNSNITINNITDSTNIDGTYFRTSDVAPVVNGNTLSIYNAKGARRSWGAPNVSSVVSELSESVVMVRVTGWHKHTVSPVGGNFYFVCEGEQWVRRTANHKAVKQALSN